MNIISLILFGISFYYLFRGFDNYFSFKLTKIKELKIYQNICQFGNNYIDVENLSKTCKLLILEINKILPSKIIVLSFIATKIIVPLVKINKIYISILKNILFYICESEYELIINEHFSNYNNENIPKINICNENLEKSLNEDELKYENYNVSNDLIKEDDLENIITINHKINEQEKKLDSCSDLDSDSSSSYNLSDSENYNYNQHKIINENSNYKNLEDYYKDLNDDDDNKNLNDDDDNKNLNDDDDKNLKKSEKIDVDFLNNYSNLIRDDEPNLSIILEKVNKTILEDKITRAQSIKEFYNLSSNLEGTTLDHIKNNINENLEEYLNEDELKDNLNEFILNKDNLDVNKDNLEVNKNNLDVNKDNNENILENKNENILENNIEDVLIEEVDFGEFIDNVYNEISKPVTDEKKYKTQNKLINEDKNETEDNTSKKQVKKVIKIGKKKI